MDLLIEFAKIGMGISGVVKEFVTKELSSGELLEFPTPFEIPTRTVAFAHHKSPLNSDTIEKFLRFVNSHSKKFSPIVSE